MKIDELIADLMDIWNSNELTYSGDYRFVNETAYCAAETIKLLWEVAKDTTNSKYKRQIDEWRGEDG